jgi:hypothetical protein
MGARACLLRLGYVSYAENLHQGGKCWLVLSFLPSRLRNGTQADPETYAAGQQPPLRATIWLASGMFASRDC